jgi:hypothetical protein
MGAVAAALHLTQILHRWEGRLTQTLYQREPEPVTIRFDLGGLTNHFAPDHSGQAQIRFGLLDRTIGETLIATNTTNIKELKGSTG